MKNCQGPCLSYCSSKFNTLYFIFGLVLGIILTTFMIKYFLKRKLEKMTINKIESLKEKYFKNIWKFITNE